jgi:hypothetical protein
VRRRRELSPRARGIRDLGLSSLGLSLGFHFGFGAHRCIRAGSNFRFSLSRDDDCAQDSDNNKRIDFHISSSAKAVPNTNKILKNLYFNGLRNFSEVAFSLLKPQYAGKGGKKAVF